MRQQVLSFMLLVSISSSAYCQEDTIYSIAYSPTAYLEFNLNDRDTGNYFYVDTSQTGNCWQIGMPSKSIFSSTISPPLALVTDTLNEYPAGNISSLTFTVYTDDVTIIAFWHQIDSDTLKDGGVVEYSDDGGLTWNNVLGSPFTLVDFYDTSGTIASNVSKPGFTGTSGWRKSEIMGGALNFVRFRFTFTSDNMNNHRDGWIIDDISVQCLGTGVGELQSSTLRVFPIPASGKIFFTCSDSERIADIEIQGSTGCTILRSKKSELDLSELQAGIYFAVVTTDHGRFVKKIILR